MADLNFIVKNGLVVNGSFTANSTKVSLGSNINISTTSISVGNSSVNATINSTSFSGSSATVGGNTAATLRSYSDTVSSSAYSNAISFVATNSLRAANATNGFSINGLAATSTLATKASTLSQGGGNGTAMTFNWSGQSGQPSWLWGSNDGTNVYVYNPSNFNVNYATSAGSATTAGTSTNLSGGSVSATSGYFSGSVGIGISPSSKFHVYNAASDNFRLQVSSSTYYNRMMFLNPSRTWTLGQSNGSDFWLADESAGLIRLAVTSGGNIGINTTLPGHRLHVEGNILVNNTIYIGNINSYIGYDAVNMSQVVNSGNMTWYVSGSNQYYWHVGGAQVAIIDNRGNFLTAASGGAVEGAPGGIYNKIGADGFLCRNGAGGNYTGHSFNINWAGDTYAQLYIDNSYQGAIETSNNNYGNIGSYSLFSSTGYFNPGEIYSGAYFGLSGSWRVMGVATVDGGETPTYAFLLKRIS